MDSAHSTSIEQKVRELANRYSANLKTKTAERVREMEADDQAHFLVYRALGITDEEGRMIDVYQNKGRFLYRYAGSFLEDAAKLCFKETFAESDSLKIPNTLGVKPKTFEIDCLLSPLPNSEAIEIKWRDATTDGDHVTKEHTRIQVIHAAGYVPVRVMFYYPNRDQAKRIQSTLKTLYAGIKGHYYSGDEAWKYVEDKTKVSLKSIIEKLADEKAPE